MYTHTFNEVMRIRVIILPKGRRLRTSVSEMGSSSLSCRHSPNNIGCCIWLPPDLGGKTLLLNNPIHFIHRT